MDDVKIENQKEETVWSGEGQSEGEGVERRGEFIRWKRRLKGWKMEEKRTRRRKLHGVERGTVRRGKKKVEREEVSVSRVEEKAKRMEDGKKEK